MDLAEKELLKSENTLFDDMIKNIENHQELRKTVHGILMDGLRIPFVKSDPVINLGAMFGVLTERDGMAGIANVVFETYLYNHMVAGKIREQYTFDVEHNQFIEDSRLDMERVLKKFQELYEITVRSPIKKTVILSKGFQPCIF